MMSKINNPFFDDETCDCCGRPESMLKPFGKSGDPIVGDHEGKYLVCRRRFYYERFHHELYKISQEFEYYGNGLNNIADLAVRYGDEKANDAYVYLILFRKTQKSMECRDCIVKLRRPIV